MNKTVLSNVTLGLTVGRHMKKEEAEKTGKELLDKVGLCRKVRLLPGTAIRRHAAACRNCTGNGSEPEVILFGDRTSALDPELVGEVLNVMKQSQNRESQ